MSTATFRGSRTDIVDALLTVGLVVGVAVIAARLWHFGHPLPAVVGYGAISPKDVVEWGSAIGSLVGSGCTAAAALLLLTRRFFGWPYPQPPPHRPRKRKRKGPPNAPPPAAAPVPAPAG